MKIDILNKSDFELPKYETDGSVGMDMRSNVDMIIEPNKRDMVSTGIFVSLPGPFYNSLTDEKWGYEIQIRPRSGLSAKKGIIILNTPGTIDMDYRGEIKVILYNTNDEPFVINKGDRIAQMVFNRIEIVEWNKVSELSETKRGEGGFGSTQIK